MKKKVRITGFARFIIFLVIVIPLSLLIANLIQGNEISSPKDLINVGDKTTKVIDVNKSKTSTSDKDKKILQLETEVEYLQKKIAELEKENELLKTR